MFNPLMFLLVRSVLDLLCERPSVIELGNQTLRPSRRALDAVINRSKGVAGIDCDGIKRLKDLVDNPIEESAALYYRCLGFSRYDAIDINDRYGSLVMDLNEDLRKVYRFTDTYDLVTNHGTGEHIFDQAQVLRNMHNLAKPGGIILQVLPMLNNVNHGFYCYQPCLFYALSRANDYELMALGLANRRGRGAMAKLAPRSECLPPYLLEESHVELGEFLGPARFDLAKHKSPLRRFRRRLTHRGKKRLNGLGRLVAEFDLRYRDMYVVAVMRKIHDRRFRVPVQTIYEDDFTDPKMMEKYSARYPAVEGAR